MHVPRPIWDELNIDVHGCVAAKTLRGLVDKSLYNDQWHPDLFAADMHTDSWVEQNAFPIARMQIPVFPAGYIGRYVIPADLHKRLGRKKRKRDEDREGKAICQACGGKGHYSVTCPEPNIVRWTKVLLDRTLKAMRKVVIEINGDDNDDED